MNKGKDGTFHRSRLPANKTGSFADVIIQKYSNKIKVGRKTLRKDKKSENKQNHT